MDEPTPSPKPPFVTGLPDAPLERPSDFPGYDGPLVCPFYGPDHPARRDEESTEAFNEDVARVAFGDAKVDMLMQRQGRFGCEFYGDWWMLAFLRHAAALADAKDPSRTGLSRFDWRVFSKAEKPGSFFIHLEGAALGGLHLEYICLNAAHLEHADFFHANLCHASLHHAHLISTTMRFTNLQDADLFAAKASGIVLVAAQLQQARLIEVEFKGADLAFAHLEHSKLRACVLDGAKLSNAYLDGCDVRSSSGILFDDNAAQRLNIEGNAPDPWSTLRRTYTGPMFFVHLLLVVAFLLPYAAKVLTLTTTARGYEALRQSLEAGEGVPPRGEVVRAWLEHFDASHTQTHALWVLLGGTHAWWWAMLPTALAILCYNVLRGHLTLTIGVLRDQADRVERTPTLVEYYGHCHPLAEKDAGVRRIPAVWWRRFKKWRKGKDRWKNKGQLNPLPVIGPWHLHQLARVLFWISIASVALHVGSWLLTTTVPVPK